MRSTQQRLHHAYLFTGTRGVGKTTVSRILAKALNCTGADGRAASPPSPAACASACSDIDAGRFVDYIELDAASQPRRRRDRASCSSRRSTSRCVGRFKVFMIDEVHMLTNDRLQRDAQDAGGAARVPEVRAGHDRPAEGAAHRAVALPAVQPAADGAARRCRSTWRRCWQPKTSRPSRGALRLLSRAARGSMRDALSLTDQAIAFGGGALDEAGVRAMLGASTAAMRCAWSRRWRARDGAARGGRGRRAARARPVGRRHAGGDGRAAAADGGAAGRARRAATTTDPDAPTLARLAAAAAGRRDAVALQHRAARPRRAARWRPTNTAA